MLTDSRLCLRYLYTTHTKSTSSLSPSTNTTINTQNGWPKRISRKLSINENWEISKPNLRYIHAIRIKHGGGRRHQGVGNTTDHEN